MDSPEGKGIARDRYETWADEKLADVVESVMDPYNMPVHYDSNLDDVPDAVRDQIADAARDDSEAIGFWVAWHLAGGFERLEKAGWHRATIYRKLHRFRANYGTHPDEYVFPHIKLDTDRYWTDQTVRYFTPVEPPSLDEILGED